MNNINGRVILQFVSTDCNEFIYVLVLMIFFKHHASMRSLKIYCMSLRKTVLQHRTKQNNCGSGLQCWKMIVLIIIYFPLLYINNINLSTMAN